MSVTPTDVATHQQKCSGFRHNSESKIFFKLSYVLEEVFTDVHALNLVNIKNAFC